MNKKTKINLGIGIIGIITIYSGIKLNKRYKLQKEYGSFKNITINSSPYMIRKDSLLNKELLSKITYSDYISNFINSILEKDSSIDLSTFNYNLNSLEIISKNLDLENLLNRTHYAGYYIPEYNKIFIENISSLNHELFHMSSSIYDNDNNYFYSGFCQENCNNSIAFGLDEGYTQLLTERFFQCDEYKDIYVFEKLVAGKIEDIIGRKKMQESYFHSDLKSIICELERYVELEEIIKFLRNLDFFCNYSIDVNFANYSNLVLKVTNDIASFLVKIYCIKIIDEANSKDDILDMVRNFSSDFMDGICLNITKYLYYNDKNNCDIVSKIKCRYKNR